MLRKELRAVSAIVLAAALANATHGQAQPQADSIIESARNAAASYVQSLPDYIAKRTTSRYRGARPDLRYPGSTVAIWQPVDVVTSDLAVEHGKEVYTNVTLNGVPSLDLPTRGAWSSGEFSTDLLAVLAPDRDARFSRQKSEVIRNRQTWRYDYGVDQSHSAWNLSAENLRNMAVGSKANFAPSYSGAIWIDKESGQVLRVEMAAGGLGTFPLDTIESNTDFDFVKIGGAEYVLPVRSVSFTCERGAFVCLKNETDFRDYDKFGASANITFDDGAK